MRTHSTLAALATAAALPAALLISPAATGAPRNGSAPSGPSTATGTVFWPNPVQSSGDQSLRDADDADWQTNPQAYRIERVLVDHTTVLRLRLAAGGGQAVRLRPASPDEAARLPRYNRP